MQSRAAFTIAALARLAGAHVALGLAVQTNWPTWLPMPVSSAISSSSGSRARR